MHKFEDIMGKSNYEAFKLLVKAARNDKLVCYVGAGLSIYSKRWGEPFEVMVDELIGCAIDSNPSCDISGLKRKLNELYLIRYSLDRIKANNNAEKLQEAVNDLMKSYPLASEEDKTNCEEDYLYPELGDKIENIIIDSKSRCINLKEQDTFNKWFCKVIEEIEDNKSSDKANKEIYLSGNPYSFSSTYYLPYLGKRAKFITTNCDHTFEHIGLKLGDFDSYKNSNWAIKCYEKPWYSWFEESDTNQIFYIHGHISAPDSLVMSQSSYEQMYVKEQTAKIFHINASASHTLLFLGASLNNDKTVEIVNQCANDFEISPEHFIPILPTKKVKDECKLENMKPISFDGDYGDISIILHQLIREAHADDEDIFSWKQNLNVEPRNIDPNLEQMIIGFLNEDTAFDSMEFKEEQYQDILAFLYHHYLYENTEKRGPEWTICQIFDSQFQFIKWKKGKKEDGPLHNYPLGNTIYMLGGFEKDSFGIPRMSNDHIDRISNQLKQWMENEYPKFSENERFSKLEGVNSGQLKVRVIKFPSSWLIDEINLKGKELESTNNKREQINEIEETIRKEESKIDELKKTFYELTKWSNLYADINPSFFNLEDAIAHIEDEKIQLTEKQETILGQRENLIEEFLNLLPANPNLIWTLIHLLINLIFMRPSVKGKIATENRNNNANTLALKPNANPGGDI